MFFYFFIFLILVLIGIFASFSKSFKWIFFAVFGIFLILLAGLRPIGVDLDSLSYAEMFSRVGFPGEYFRNVSDYSFFEPAYYLIPSVIGVSFGLAQFWIFLLFASLGISLKFLAITKLSDFLFLSVLVYFSHFFILHDMTQIRVGVASGVLLLSIIEIQKRNLMKFLILILVGLMFHYSIIIFVPFFFLNAKKINKGFYFGLLFTPYLLYLFRVNVITILNVLKLGVFSEKIQMYNDLVASGIFTDINILNVMFLIQLFFCCLFIWKSDLLMEKNIYSILLIKIYCYGAASFILLYNVPVLAFRISELLGIVQIVLLPLLLHIVKPVYFASLVIVLLALIYLSINIVHVGLLKPYFGNFES